MVAECHRHEAKRIHPISYKSTVCKIGLGATLPHITRGQEYCVFITYLFEIGSEACDTVLCIARSNLAVQVIDGIQVDNDYYRLGAFVTIAVVINIDVLCTYDTVVDKEVAPAKRKRQDH